MAKKGQKYKCKECGLVVLIEEPCGCVACDLICCGAPMNLARVAKSKAKRKTKPRAKPKTKSKAKSKKTKK